MDEVLREAVDGLVDAPAEPVAELADEGDAVGDAGRAGAVEEVRRDDPCPASRGASASASTPS